MTRFTPEIHSPSHPQPRPVTREDYAAALKHQGFDEREISAHLSAIGEGGADIHAGPEMVKAIQAVQATKDHAATSPAPADKTYQDGVAAGRAEAGRIVSVRRRRAGGAVGVLFVVATTGPPMVGGGIGLFTREGSMVNRFFGGAIDTLTDIVDYIHPHAPYIPEPLRSPDVHPTTSMVSLSSTSEKTSASPASSARATSSTNSTSASSPTSLPRTTASTTAVASSRAASTFAPTTVARAPEVIQQTQQPPTQTTTR